MFCSLLQQYFKYENSFQSPLDVIGTLLPALVIHNQVISMPKALHEFLWTSDVVRRKASFCSYRFSCTAVLHMKQQHLVLCFQSWMFTSGKQLGSSLNTSCKRGISKIGGFSPCVWLTWSVMAGRLHLKTKITHTIPIGLLFYETTEGRKARECRLTQVSLVQGKMRH